MTYTITYLSSNIDKFNKNKKNYIFAIDEDLYNKLSNNYSAVWEYNDNYYLRLRYDNKCVFRPEPKDNIVIDDLQQLTYNNNDYLKFSVTDFNKLFMIEDNSKTW